MHTEMHTEAPTAVPMHERDPSPACIPGLPQGCSNPNPAPALGLYLLCPSTPPAPGLALSAPSQMRVPLLCAKSHTLCVLNHTLCVPNHTLCVQDELLSLFAHLGVLLQSFLG